MRSYEFPYRRRRAKRLVVSRFGGIDCRTHPIKVSLSRSPDMQNMICDQNDFLVKRTDGAHRAQFNAPILGYSPCRMVWAVPFMRVQKLYFRAPDGTRSSCAET